MDAEKLAQIQSYAEKIAELLYEEADPEQVKTLAGIETTVRSQILSHVSPSIGLFLSKKVAVQQQAENAASTASLAR